MLWGDSKIGAVQARSNRYVKNKKFTHLRRGIYAKDSNYNKYELVNHIARPSYVSFETVTMNKRVSQYYRWFKSE